MIFEKQLKQDKGLKAFPQLELTTVSILRKLIKQESISSKLGGKA
jgi:hypothetical protein